MVKVYVELVWDIHFPGKLTEEENRAEEMGVRDKEIQGWLENKTNFDREKREGKSQSDQSVKAQATAPAPLFFKDIKALMGVIKQDTGLD